MHKVLFWTSFGEPLGISAVYEQWLIACVPGLVVRLWQLAIEMRPFFNKEGLWAYPFFGGIGGSFGYWMMTVERSQAQTLAERRDRLLEKRARRAEREAAFREGEQKGTILARGL